MTGDCEECNKKRSLQRRADNQGEPSAVPPIVHDVLRSSGKPLDNKTRDFMESRFGHDFGQVRVHTDSSAAESARAVNAHAYTVGKEIVFAQGQFAPHTEEGQHLLAHELAHTLQQKNAGAVMTETNDSLEVGQQNDPAEREADAIATSALTAVEKPVTASVQGDGAALRRDDDGGTEAGKEPEAPKDAGGEKEKPPEQPGGDAGTAAGTGTSSPTVTCAPKALSRADYLKEPGTSTKDFGLTTLSGSVSVPVVQTSKTAKGLVLDPTDAKLPPLTSVFTGAGKFIEGEVVSIGEDVECQSGKKYPIQWTILPLGATKIKEAEEEHCADFQHAFAISLRRYADVVNDLSGKKKVFPSQKAAENYVTGLVGPKPDTWSDVFTCLAKKTKDRDTSWHTPRPLMKPPRFDDDCKFARAIIHSASLPEVDQTKHPTADVIRDCGEGPPPPKGAGKSSGSKTKTTPAPKVEGKTELRKPADSTLLVVRETLSATARVKRSPVDAPDEASSSEIAPSPAEAAPASSNRTGETPNAEPTTGLIVEDDVRELIPGQMRKSEFLSELRQASCAAADAELVRVGRSTDSCPYISRAFERYRTQDSSRLERALRRYAPEAIGSSTAREYVDAVSRRVGKAVALWATTGEIKDVPDELMAEVGGTGLMRGLLSGLGGAVGGLLGGLGSVFSGFGQMFFKGREGGARADAVSAASVEAQLGAGRALDGGIKAPMERALGHDFSRVRVHTDAQAAALSSKLNARAFTIGENLAFGSSEYRPGTLVGDALIAHELAHVVQQSNAPSRLQEKTEGEDSALEMDADMSAIGAIAAVRFGAKGMLASVARSAVPRIRSGLGLQRCATTPKKETLTPREVKLGQPGSNRCEAPERQSMEAVNLCCTESMIGEIQTVLGQAIPAVESAITNLANPKSLSDQLWNNFRVKPDDEASVGQIRLILGSIKSSMESSKVRYMCNHETDFACAGEGAKTGPTCSPGSDIIIRLCAQYPLLEEDAKQKFLTGSRWVRTMIHEHAHAGCPGSGLIFAAGDEFYKEGKKGGPYPQSANRNIKNADCYAWFVMDSK